MDVCKFLSLENTSSMRYSDKVKEFWRIGFKLFHGKWFKKDSWVDQNTENNLFYIYTFVLFFTFLLYIFEFFYITTYERCVHVKTYAYFIQVPLNL